MVVASRMALIENAALRWWLRVARYGGFAQKGRGNGARGDAILVLPEVAMVVDV